MFYHEVENEGKNENKKSLSGTFLSNFISILRAAGNIPAAFFVRSVKIHFDI
jgi:hypothetical protein